MGAGEPIARSVAPCGLTEFQVPQRASISLDGSETIVKRQRNHWETPRLSVTPIGRSSFLLVLCARRRQCQIVLENVGDISERTMG